MENSLYLVKEPNTHLKDCYFNFCGYSKTEPRHSFGPAIRKQYLIHIVLEGQGYYLVNDQKYYLRKGQGFVIPPGISTFYQADENNPWSYVWLGLSGDLVEYYLKEIGVGKDHLTFKVDNLSLFKGLIFETLSYDQDNLVSELSRQKQVYKFLELLLSSASHLKEGIVTKKMNPFVRQAIEIIRENAYQKISVKDIATMLSLHENYLSRLFKLDMGISIKEYISEIKLSIANDLLSSTEYSIQQISDKIGFSTVQSFSKAFKKANGVSPGIYRKHRLGLWIIKVE